MARIRFFSTHELYPHILTLTGWVIAIAILWAIGNGASVWIHGALPKEICIPLTYVEKSPVRALVPIPDSLRLTVIGVRKSCDCVLVPNLPWSNQTISDDMDGLNLDVMVDPSDKFPLEREVALFLGPPHSRSLRVLIKIEDGR